MKTVNNLESFKQNQLNSALIAAKQVLGWATQRYALNTFIDVGCGVGCWMEIARSYGLSVTGIDHPCMEPVVLSSVAKSIVFKDLEQENAFDELTTTIDKNYDIAICLEIGEHLEARCADPLVRFLVNHSDLILFSAAIPNRVNPALPVPYNGFHKNEQWQQYWVDKFSQHDYLPCEIRPFFWDDAQIPHWYKQSMFLFKNKHLGIAPEILVHMPNLVHPEQYLNKVALLEEKV